MTVLEMLTEVIGPEELFGLVAFTKFMDIGKMCDAISPIRLRLVTKFPTTITTYIYRSCPIRGRCRLV